MVNFRMVRNAEATDDPGGDDAVGGPEGALAVEPGPLATRLTVIVVTREAIQ